MEYKNFYCVFSTLQTESENDIIDDIRTWEEVLKLNDEREGQFVWGDFSRVDAEQAFKDGTITVYSSYPIKNGVFVSTSYVQAQEYAGGKNGKVYSKTIPLTDVAWINGDEGQHAKLGVQDYSRNDGEIKKSFALEIPSKQENEDGPFSVGSPMQQARQNFEKYEHGEISREEYLEENDRLWGKANETYGIIEQGENANAPIATPKAVAEDKLTQRFIRTIIETGALDDKMLEGVEEKVLLGDFSYKVILDEKQYKLFLKIQVKFVDIKNIFKVY